MANKDFKVKNGLDIQSPLPVSMGGTGQTSTTNTLNALLPSQVGNSSKILSTDGTNTTWVAQPTGYSIGNTASRPGSPIDGQIYSNTQTGFIEIYSSTYGWEQVGGIASQVTGVTATNSPTNRVYNNGAASISFTPGTILGRSYTVTSSPGSYTATGTSSPITITGLQSSTQYTYTVVATNNYGSAAASSASSGVTATTTPQAPTIGSATATGSTGSVYVNFTAGATGGASITNYKYSTDNITYTALSPAQTSSPLTISGLTDGQSYVFYLKAVNSNGDSTASSASNSATPAALPTTIEVLVAAGGGSGGGVSGTSAGGGGAGGVRTNLSYSVVGSTNYSITIGGGGAGVTSSNTTNNGSSSTFGNITCSGGGGGAPSGTSVNGNSGGSGGGGMYNSAGGSGNAGGYSPVEGYAGGNGSQSTFNTVDGPNTGSGGGAICNSDAGYKGGNGGSGIVIVAFPTSKAPIVNIGAGLTYTIDTSSRTGYRVYKFTAGTGNISW